MFDTELIKIYTRGKEKSLWDLSLPWEMAENDNLSETHKKLAIELASLSLRVEQIGMRNAAELLIQCDDLDLKLCLAQAINDEARHTEVFSRYVSLSSGKILGNDKTKDKFNDHFDSLNSFDDIFLSHAYLEALAMESFNVYQGIFGDDSLIGKIYRGVMIDEARHVAFGVSYFKKKAELDPDLFVKYKEHFEKNKDTLVVSDSAINWLAEISGFSKDVISANFKKKAEGFLEKISPYSVKEMELEMLFTI